jgi:RHS repeat-associated protein
MMKYLQSDTGQARGFLYDADDERIMTFDCAFVDGDCAVPAQLTTTIRGLDGKVLRIYNQPFGGAWNWERDYVYRDGQLLASVEPNTEGGEDTVHFHLDHLGSPRQITDELGVQAAFHSYYPFGGEATDPSQDDVELKFTGHERDDNGGAGAGALDYMHARHFSPRLGRFLSTDPERSIKLPLPQTWNRYSYTSNRPMSFIDTDGRETRMAIMFEADARALLAGEISPEEFRARNASRAKGALVAASFYIPGPEDLVFLGLAAKASVRTSLGARIGGFFKSLFGKSKAATTVTRVSSEALGRLSPQARKAVQSLEKRIVEHRAKLESFRNNPDAFDNKGFLANAPSQEIRDDIIQGRIRHLEREIGNFEKQIKMYLEALE